METIDQITDTVTSIRNGKAFEIGKWTIQKCGAKFKLSHSTIQGNRIVSEKGLQIILKNHFEKVREEGAAHFRQTWGNRGHVLHDGSYRIF